LSLEPNPTERAAADGAAADGAAVLDAVRTILADVIGEDYVSELEIGPDTTFYGDLEIESIEFVALAEQLQARYGSRVDFAAWMATMEMDEIIAMTVGRLVDYIVTALS
jgi:acyl carrier protein